VVDGAGRASLRMLAIANALDGLAAIEPALRTGGEQ
jgi:hypothetical protein